MRSNVNESRRFGLLVLAVSWSLSGAGCSSSSSPATEQDAPGELDSGSPQDTQRTDGRTATDATDATDATAGDATDADATVADASPEGGDAGAGDGTPTDMGLDATADAADGAVGDTGPADSGPADTGPADTGPADTGPADSGPVDTGPADAGCVQLTVKNYLAWCSVSVAGATSSSAAVQTACVPRGTVSLSAQALSGFILGPAPWHDTLGDHGSGDPGTVTGSGASAQSATSVVVSASSACVWVCCPFPDGSGCPATDQCP
jgi:hypothetical protein